MVTIIIFGLILFIVAVGATYLHDHMKAGAAERELSREASRTAKVSNTKRVEDFAKANADELAKQIARAQSNAASLFKSKTTTTTNKSIGKRVVKPSASKTNYNKLSSEENMSLQELINHIESLKKK